MANPAHLIARPDGRDAAAVGVQVFRAGAMADLPALMAFIDAACDAVTGDGDVRFAVRLAVEEMFTSILAHGYRGNGPVRVAVDGWPHCIRVRLSDQAPVFDPVDAPAADTTPPLDGRDPGGPGWHLVCQLMDEVEHRPASVHGNIFTLVKQLPAGSRDTREPH